MCLKNVIIWSIYAFRFPKNVKNSSTCIIKLQTILNLDFDSRIAFGFSIEKISEQDVQSYTLNSNINTNTFLLIVSNSKQLQNQPSRYTSHKYGINTMKIYFKIIIIVVLFLNIGKKLQIFIQNRIKKLKQLTHHLMDLQKLNFPADLLF